ncbi:TIR domain-containing protein [Bradyrhizobium sp. 195]|uniref:TIR domain-containing protein n=1 Tax=Bradyrhizobium sp. 195 TaxID=2782662 RepID=UPI00200125B9|nr:TIR domain-containing protein [Bradyrhizobium sp. 195]UPK26760.1 toll/interleukin-1 receptor domain-containing protein [Bradyrhizobium sp. 195]
MRYIFISYASLDRATVKPILGALLAAGIPLWIDRPGEVGIAAHRLALPGIRSGASWEDEIRKAYEGAACVLFFLSRNSNNPARSDSLFREFDHGSAKNKLVIAKLDDIGREEMSGLVRIRQAVDLSAFDRTGSTNLDELIAELHRFVLNEGVAPNQSGKARSKRFARLLPYLCDRRTQRRYFREAIESELERDVVRPQIFFVLGEDSQCADKFVEQLFFVDMPELLQRNGLSNVVEDRLLRWPADIDPRADVDEIRDYLNELQYELADKIGLKHRSSLTEIERRLQRQSGALFLYFDVDIRKWNTAHRRLLGEWINWWNWLSMTGRHYPIIVVGRFCSADQGIWAFASRSLIMRLLNDLTVLSTNAGNRVMTAILPQLGHIGFEDIEAWINENADFAAEAPPDLRQRLRKFFTGWLGIGERKVPMVQAATLLRMIIDEMKISTDIPQSQGGAS